MFEVLAGHVRLDVIWNRLSQWEHHATFDKVVKPRRRASAKSPSNSFSNL